MPLGRSRLTGQATLIGNHGITDIAGMALIAPVPEPTGSAIAAAAALLRRGRSYPTTSRRTRDCVCLGLLDPRQPRLSRQGTAWDLASAFYVRGQQVLYFRRIVVPLLRRSCPANPANEERVRCRCNQRVVVAILVLQ